MAHVQWARPGFLVSTDPSLLQIDAIHAFLSQEAYWCLGIPKTVVQKALDHSLAFGVYHLMDGGDGYAQIGLARVITDYATFAYISDVYILPQHRGNGLCTWLMECILAHRDLQGLRRVCLTTRDAQAMYSKHGFKPAKSNWMEITDWEMYRRMAAPSNVGLSDKSVASDGGDGNVVERESWSKLACQNEC